MKINKILVASLAVAATLGLASCKSELTQAKAEERIKGWNPTVTTVDATYNAKYDLLVDSSDASMQAFARSIDDKSIVQIDYTAGNIYFYGKKTEKSSAITENLVYKDGADYYYLTSTSANPIKIANEADAVKKVNELVASLTKREAGFIDEKTFKYTMDYAQHVFLLDSENVVAEKPTYKDNKGGIEADYAMEYIGYLGDQGSAFEFKGTNQALVKADDKGLVSSYTETISGHLDMAIVTPAIPLDLSGTRAFSAIYGGSLTKKTTIDHKALESTVELVSATNGTYAVTSFNLANPAVQNPVTNNGKVEYGQYLGVKPTPAAGYELNAIKVNGKETTVINNGIYCFLVDSKASKVEVTFKKLGEEVPKATIVYETVTNGTFTAKSFNISNPAVQTPIVANEKLIPNANLFVSVYAIPASGYKLDKITVNGGAPLVISFDQYFFNVKAAIEYKITVTFVAE